MNHRRWGKKKGQGRKILPLQIVHGQGSNIKFHVLDKLKCPSVELSLNGGVLNTDLRVGID